MKTKKPFGAALAAQSLLLGLLFAWMAPAAQAASVPFVPSDLNPGDNYHVVFLTQGERNAASSDIADYNAFVQGEAQRTGALTETWGVDWFAIASTSAVDAKDNIPVTTAPIYVLSDDRVADDAEDLWDGTIQVTIQTDQFGDFVPGDAVWTGTSPDGTVFIEGLGGAFSRVGETGNISRAWVSLANNSVDEINAFYAVSEELTVIPVPAAVWLFGSALVGLVGVAGRRKLAA